MNSPAKSLGWLMIVVMAGILLYPAATPVHVEGFSASIVSLGLHLREGALSSYDLIYPVNLEFFALSRLGAAIGVAGFVQLGQVSGDEAMRLMMWAATSVLLMSTLVCVRRWTNVPWTLAAVSLLLVPGMIENSYFFNDNVPAGALLVAGLAILSTTRRAWATVVAGALLGAAVICRFDTVVPAVAAPIVVLIRPDSIKRRVVDVVLCGCAAFAVMVIIPALFDRTILDTIQISATVIALWQRPSSWLRHTTEFLTFVGLPGFLLLAAAILTLTRARQHALLSLLLVPIVLVNIVSMGKLWQSRQLLTLAPFICALVAVELSHLLGVWTQHRVRAALLAIPALAFAVAALVGPHVSWLSDGPRTITGRLAGLSHWTAWQRDVRDDFALIDAEVRGDDTLLVMTTDWDADRYVHLTLQLSGHTVDASGAGIPECRLVEVFRRQERVVRHLRLHIPFVQRSRTLAQRRYIDIGADCIRQLASERVTIVGRKDDYERLMTTMGAMRKDSSMRRTPHTSPGFAADRPNRNDFMADSMATTNMSALAGNDTRALQTADSLLSPEWLTRKLQRSRLTHAVW
jgi:hypothetical protein